MDPLTNSMSQVSENEKRRKRIAEIKAMINASNRAAMKAQTMNGVGDPTSPDMLLSSDELSRLYQELDSLNY